MSMFLYPNRAKQLIDFSSLCWGKVHPSDIDAVLEFGGKKLVLIELKTKGKDVDLGQRILLERLAKNWKSTEGNEAIVIYAEHEQFDTNEVVDLGKATVKSVYWNSQNYEFNHPRTVQSMVYGFAEKEIKERLDKECSQLKP